MPNIASLLKAEIVRLARKELRGQTETLRKSLSASRAEVVALKRRVSELEKGVRQAQRKGTRVATGDAPPKPDVVGAERLRFRAAGLASNRRRLGLSAADFGVLVGASGQSVYAWEQGKARPRGRHLAAIASLRSIGKREAAARLAAAKSKP